MDIFYFSKREDNKSLIYHKIFVEEFVSSSKKEAIVLFDSKYDQEIFKGSMSINPNIIPMYVLDDIYNLLNDKYLLNAIDRWFPKTAWNSFSFIENFGKKFYRTILSYAVAFENILSRETIRFIHFGDNQAFRSIGANVLQECAKHHDIPFFMIYNTPLKGRYMVYDNLNRVPDKDFIDIYLRRRDSVLNKKYRSCLEEYFKRYSEFQCSKQSERFKKKKRKQKRKTISFRNISRNFKSNLINYLLKRKYKDISINSKPIGPFFLFLLNKTNNWTTNYAIPFDGDINYLVRCVWMSLPKGYSLIVKDHPLVGFPNKNRIKLYQFSKRVSNFHYFDGNEDTWELVNNATAILFNCSTSGAESLIRMKHVIVFGNGRVFFDFPEAPVKKVSDIHNLFEILNSCIVESPPCQKIYAYFNTILECSENYSGSSNNSEIDMTQNEEYYRRMGKYLFQSMKRRKIVE